MNDNFNKFVQYNNSGFGCLLTLLLGAILLSSIGLGWIVNSLVVFVILLAILPVFVWFGFRWWVTRNLVEDQCPVCSYELTGFNQTKFRCPNCGEPLEIKSGRFQRLTPEGTVDVEAVEVSVQNLEDGK